MRVLIDTNIVLDYLLDREPFLQDAEALFNAIVVGRAKAHHNKKRKSERRR